MKQSCLRLRRFFRERSRRYINGTKGVISLFLAILMVPFVSIAGALINAARVNSAVAIFDEALCNASNSTLGTYDEFLKSRFGLLAIAQHRPEKGSFYAVDDLISDTFRFYMEKNVKALSNTYTDFQADAKGVYPLSNPDVMLMEVMEYGKYSVPTKLAIDGFSLDDILATLTKGVKQAEPFAELGSSAAGIVSGLDGLQESIDDAREKLKTCEDGQSKCQTIYGAFDAAVEDYNNTVTERNEKVAECEAEVAAAEADVASADKDSRAEAEARLQAAQKRLEETIETYRALLEPKRALVKSERQEYETNLEKFLGQVTTAWKASVKVQSDFESIRNDGMKAIKSAGDLANAHLSKDGKDELKKAKEYKEKLSKQADEAKTPEDREAIQKELSKQDQLIKQYEDQLTNASNENKVFDAGIDAVGDAEKYVDDLIEMDIDGAFREIYQEADVLTNEVRHYTASESDSAYCPSVSSYSCNYELPVTQKMLTDLEENLAEKMASSSFIAIIKAIISFFKAIVSLNVAFDPELSANIQPGKIGGLPSHHSPSSQPSFLEGDRQQSEYYKSVIGSYSSSAFSDGSIGEVEYIMAKLEQNLDIIFDKADHLGGLGFFTKLAKMVEAVGNIFSLLAQLMQKMMQIITGGDVYQKLLLTGYLGYNTANRTTYSGSALTGASYDLPTKASSQQGYCFYGAETEYIIQGGTSEIGNQTAVFGWVYLVRFVLNLVYVSINSQVWSFVEAATAATAVIGGIGGIILLVLYYLVEPFVDAILLVNGGQIPIVKLTIYLTPSGIVDFIEEVYHLGITNAGKQKIYNCALDMANSSLGPDFAVSAEQLKDTKYLPPSADSGGGTGGGISSGTAKVLGTFKVDYTQTLIFLMLFNSSDKMLKRLGDIVQMECSYQAATVANAHSFDLNKSYTYLRASGSFTTNEFIRLSDEDGIDTTKRVVYRGY